MVWPAGAHAPIVVYMAHPIAAPDAAGVEANLGAACRWFRYLVDLPDELSRRISWCAPWYLYAAALDDRLGPYRRRGMRDTLALLERCDAALAIGRLTEDVEGVLARAAELQLPASNLFARGPLPPPMSTANWWADQPHRFVLAELHQLVRAVDVQRLRPSA